MILETSELKNPSPGVYPVRFQGAWHGSKLVLRVTYDLVEHHAYGNARAPVSVTFHNKGYGAFQAECPGA